MINLSFITNKTKTILGILSLILCIIVRLITPYYVGFAMLLFAIPAICLIIPIDSIKNARIIAIITFVFVAVAILLSLEGILNPYSVLSNLFVNGQMSTVPTMGDITTCVIGNLIVVIYALFNILCGISFFAPTTSDPGF